MFFGGQGVRKSMNRCCGATPWPWRWRSCPMVTYPWTNNDLDFQSHPIEIEHFNYHHWFPWPRKHTHEQFYTKIRSESHRSRGLQPHPPPWLQTLVEIAWLKEDWKMLPFCRLFPIFLADIIHRDLNIYVLNIFNTTAVTAGLDLAHLNLYLYS